MRQSFANWYASPMGTIRMHKCNLLIAFAWVVHCASWFLPVLKISGAKSIRGWIAFRAALSVIWPYEDLHFDTWYYATLSTFSAVTTLLFVIGSPWVVCCGSRSVRKASALVAALAFIINSHWYILFGSDRKDLSSGYFLWWASFGLLSFGLFRCIKPAQESMSSET